MKIAFVLACVVAFAMADAKFPKEMMCSISAQGYVVESTFHDTPVWFMANMTRVNDYTHLIIYQAGVGTYAEMLVRPDEGTTYLFLYGTGFGCFEVPYSLSLSYYSRQEHKKEGCISFGFDLKQYGEGWLHFNESNMDLVGEYFRFPIDALEKVLTFDFTYNVTVDKDYKLEKADNTFVMDKDMCENATKPPKDALTSKCNEKTASESSSWLILPSSLVLALLLALAIFF